MSEAARMLLLLARPLLLTVAIELVLSLALLRQRSVYAALVVALAQAVTNPSVQLVCAWSGWSPAAPLVGMPWAALCAAELAAVVVEALLYRMAGITRRPWLLSAVLNAASFAVGLVYGVSGLL